MNYVYKIYFGLTVYYACNRTLTKFSNYVFDAYVFRTKKTPLTFFYTRNFPSKNMVFIYDGVVQNISFGSSPIKTRNINLICGKLEREIANFFSISNKTIHKMVIEPALGSHISTIERQVAQLSMTHNLDVQFDFNDVRYICDKESQLISCLGKVKDLKQP